MKIRTLVFFAFVLSIFQGVDAATLTVSVKGVKTLSGDLLVAVYDNKESFQKDAFKNVKVPATSDTVEFTIEDLVAGEFAIMLFHDIDADMKLKKNFVGMPREPWGASLQGKSVFGPPKWKDVVFEVSDNDSTLEIALR